MTREDKCKFLEEITSVCKKHRLIIVADLAVSATVVVPLEDEEVKDDRWGYSMIPEDDVTCGWECLDG